MEFDFQLSNQEANPVSVNHSILPCSVWVMWHRPRNPPLSLREKGVKHKWHNFKKVDNSFIYFHYTELIRTETRS